MDSEFELPSPDSSVNGKSTLLERNRSKPWRGRLHLVLSGSSWLANGALSVNLG